MNKACSSIFDHSLKFVLTCLRKRILMIRSLLVWLLQLVYSIFLLAQRLAENLPARMNLSSKNDLIRPTRKKKKKKKKSVNTKFQERCHMILTKPKTYSLFPSTTHRPYIRSCNRFSPALCQIIRVLFFNYTQHMKWIGLWNCTWHTEGELTTHFT